MLWWLWEPEHQQAWYRSQSRNIPSPALEELYTFIVDDWAIFIVVPGAYVIVSNTTLRFALADPCMVQIVSLF